MIRVRECACRLTLVGGETAACSRGAGAGSVRPRTLIALAQGAPLERAAVPAVFVADTRCAPDSAPAAMGATASGMGLGRWLYDRAYTIFLETFVYGELCPDWLTCVGIRYLLMNRVRDIYSGTLELQQKRLMSFLDEVKTMPIAVNTAEANEQHYEVDTEFYDIVLGARKKYSCALYPPELGSNRAAWDANLEKAEELMLATYCERAGLEDGMKVSRRGAALRKRGRDHT